MRSSNGSFAIPVLAGSTDEKGETMMFNRFRAAVLPLLVCGFAQAQAPGAAPAKPDSSAIQTLIQKTRKAGGPRWEETVHFFCEAPRANSATDPLIEPTKIFDNVYAIGNQGTVAYVIQTSAGLLMKALATLRPSGKSES